MKFCMWLQACFCSYIKNCRENPSYNKTSWLLETCLHLFWLIVLHLEARTYSSAIKYRSEGPRKISIKSDKKVTRANYLKFVLRNECVLPSLYSSSGFYIHGLPDILNFLGISLKWTITSGERLKSVWERKQNVCHEFETALRTFMKLHADLTIEKSSSHM